MDLQFDSRQRLHHLRQQREQHLATTRDLGREIADLRAIVVAAQNRLRQLEVQPGEIGFTGREAIAAEAARLAKKIEDVEAELAELSARQANASESWNSAARLLASCLNFARENGLPIPSALRDESVSIRSAGL